MSQIIKSLTSGPVPPTVPTIFPTDVNSPAIPAANTLNIFGNFVTDNNNNGIQTDGSSGGNTVTVQLTNRILGTVTTTDATLTTIVTFPLPTDGTYAFDFNIAAYNTTDILGAGYSLFVGMISTAGVATKLNLEDKIVNEQTGMSGCQVSAAASGGSIIIQVTGLGAPNKTINWIAIGTYVFVGP